MKRKSEIIRHLKGDIKTFNKEKHEDIALLKKLGKSMAHKKKAHSKKQSHAARMDESLGMRHGKESKHKQSLKDRRHEAMGMKKRGCCG